MLEKLVGMDPKSAEFEELASQLQDEGKGERERIGGQVDRSKAKNTTPKKRAQKKAKNHDEDEDE